MRVFDPHGGWSAAGETLADRSQWERFFEGLRLLSSLSGWIGGRGRARNDQFGRIVIQSVLRNHSDIRELTGTEALQTARIVTLIDEAGDMQIYLALFKIIVGLNLHDNYNYGLSGNLTANIDLATGALS